MDHHYGAHGQPDAPNSQGGRRQFWPVNPTVTGDREYLDPEGSALDKDIGRETQYPPQAGLPAAEHTTFSLSPQPSWTIPPYRAAPPRDDSQGQSGSMSASFLNQSYQHALRYESSTTDLALQPHAPARRSHLGTYSVTQNPPPNPGQSPGTDLGFGRGRLAYSATAGPQIVTRSSTSALAGNAGRATATGCSSYMTGETQSSPSQLWMPLNRLSTGSLAQNQHSVQSQAVNGWMYWEKAGPCFRGCAPGRSGTYARLVSSDNLILRRSQNPDHSTRVLDMIWACHHCVPTNPEWRHVGECGTCGQAGFRVKGSKDTFACVDHPQEGGQLYTSFPSDLAGQSPGLYAAPRAYTAKMKSVAWGEGSQRASLGQEDHGETSMTTHGSMIAHQPTNMGPPDVPHQASAYGEPSYTYVPP